VKQSGKMGRDREHLLLYTGVVTQKDVDSWQKVYARPVNHTFKQDFHLIPLTFRTTLVHQIHHENGGLQQ